ncbi:ABC transporter permease [Streptococcus ovis]|uniref:ABC transporter permease n=1 Tax=Streptococcus ovis TaxID=82806 RepID=UPI00037C7775|nr:ABC transporter permease [Streptococcus ovis]
MWKALQIETKKYRGLPVFRLLGLSVVVTILVTLMSIFDIKGSKELADLMSIHLVMSSAAFIKVILLPIILASLASMAVQLENRHKMWNVLKSSGVSYAHIYRVKFIYIYSCYLLSQLLEWGIIAVILKQRGFNGIVSFGDVALYGVSMLGISGFILLGHYLLSLRWSNQLISLSVAMVGSLMGIIILLISKELMKLIPYSWYGFLMTVDYVKVGDTFVKTLRPVELYPLLASVLFGILLYSVGKRMKVGD